ncbi:hypothetical protein AYL99_11582 [Fonsecaea erecta]|uniref:SET domain-containing protein n=1 Tax=Fonsecaea erecta TaxID=1367422 RepID=A0A178Z2K9_9EURO|nr:hypothetical protein AYL99_11582 [Fonsecaea erecta]OAP54048.1 hypothetical protein AYL99_11582 [Fonsecaea erecta]
MGRPIPRQTRSQANRRSVRESTLLQRTTTPVSTRSRRARRDTAKKTASNFPPSSTSQAAETPRILRPRTSQTQNSGSIQKCQCDDQCLSTSCLNRFMKTECHSGNCALPWCHNRPFTNPPRHRFEVFDTGLRGQGLRTIKPLAPGFVIEYKGKIRTESSGRPYSSYCISLGNGLVLDASEMDTQARYINHSCDPNCEVWNCIGADNKNHIGIFAKVAIKAGTELTISYFGSSKDRGHRTRPRGSDKKCLCGTDKCRGNIWA